MTEKQRQKKVNALFTTPLCTVSEVYYLVDKPLQASQHVSGVSSSTNNPLNRLNVPDYLAQKVWEESSMLLENEDSVCVSPGCRDRSQWLVQSIDSTRKSPHFVEVCRNRQVKCEQSVPFSSPAEYVLTVLLLLSTRMFWKNSSPGY